MTVIDAIGAALILEAVFIFACSLLAGKSRPRRKVTHLPTGDGRPPTPRNVVINKGE